MLQNLFLLDLCHNQIDYQQHLELLTQEEKGDLLDCIFNFANDIEVDAQGMVGLAFSFISTQMIRDHDNYNKFLKKQQLNGSKGGRPKKEEKNPKNPRVNLETQKSLNDTVNDTDTVNDIKKIDKKADDKFQEFWNSYGKKKSLGQAKKTWEKVIKEGHNPDMIILAAKKQKKIFDDKGEGTQFMQYPSSWLNAYGWENEELVDVKIKAERVKRWSKGIPCPPESRGVQDFLDRHIDVLGREYTGIKLLGDPPYNFSMTGLIEGE